MRHPRHDIHGRVVMRMSRVGPHRGPGVVSPGDGHHPVRQVRQTPEEHVGTSDAGAQSCLVEAVEEMDKLLRVDR